MADIHSQSQSLSGHWIAAPSRAAGLYGELQPLPLPVSAPVSSALTRKARTRSVQTD